MIDGFPLTFFLPLAVHVMAGLTTGVTGVLAFRVPKHQGPHSHWGTRYLWANTVVFLTATLLSVQRWEADGYLFYLAVIGYGFALFGYVSRHFRQKLLIRSVLGKQWIVVHIMGMIGSYVVLWTAFYVDNAHLIPLLNKFPPLIFWVLPSLIGFPFLVLSLSRFTPKPAASSQRSRAERKEMI